MTVSRLLVLGSKGFIGSYLVESLLHDGHVVYGYNRSITNKTMPGLYFDIVGDFTSETKFQQLLSEYKIDIVVHLISTTVPQVGTTHVEREIMENIVPTIRLLEAMSVCNTRRIVYCSSGGTVYGDTEDKAQINSNTNPVCSYGICKLTIEKYLSLYQRMHGIEYKIARISNPYGITLRDKRQGIIPIFIKSILDGHEVFIYGNSVRDYIHINDLVCCLKKLIFYTGDQVVFNIGSGKGVHLDQIIELIEQITFRRFKSVHRYPIRSCDVKKNVLDITLTKNELNWEPKISLEEGIKDLVSSMKKLCLKS